MKQLAYEFIFGLQSNPDLGIERQLASEWGRGFVHGLLFAAIILILALVVPL